MRNVSRDRLVFVVLNAFDVLSTYLVFAVGGRELNPIMRGVLVHGWLFFFAVKLLAGYGGGLVLSRSALNLGNVLLSAVVLWNLVVLIIARGLS